ncbi:MAG: apolipoprotein N-acyltransferase [Spirochaetes bacterium]|nr:apolipoprotein N-acyltransferase [Spirochaetota bacterium]
MEEIVKKYIYEIKPVYKILAFFFFGFLWALANVGYSVALLTWFAFVPFLFLIKYENMKRGVLLSFIFGFTVYIFNLWWMMNPFLAYFDLNNQFLTGLALGLLVVCGLSAYFGFSYSLIFLISRFITYRKNKKLFYLVVPVVYTVVDYFYPKLWADQLGYSQYVFFHFSQVADIFGVSFISLLIVFSNCAIIDLIEAIWYKKNVFKHGAMFVVVIALVISSSIYGIFRYRNILEKIEQSEKVKVGLVQGNLTGFDKMTIPNSFTIDKYNRLAEELLEEDLDIMVWPETVIPATYSSAKMDFSNVKKFKKFPLLFGTHIVEEHEDGDDEYYNSLVLLSENQQKLDSYYKMQLLPFIEDMPLDFILGPVLQLYSAGEFSRGKDYKLLHLDKMKIAANICYEALFANHIRKSLSVGEERANILINATNDSWYGRSIEPMMHLHIAGMRAIENRIFLVRSTCTGHSAVFNAAGELINPTNQKSKEWFEKQGENLIKKAEKLISLSSQTAQTLLLKEKELIISLKQKEKFNKEELVKTFQFLDEFSRQILINYPEYKTEAKRISKYKERLINFLIKIDSKSEVNLENLVLDRVLNINKYISRIEKKSKGLRKTGKNLTNLRESDLDQYISPLFFEDTTVYQAALMEDETIFNLGGWIFIYILAIGLLINLIIIFVVRFYKIQAKRRAIKEIQERRKIIQLWLD